MTELLHSPLHEKHVALGAKFGEFGGWDMPLEYEGQGVVAEHTAVRTAVGLFDVSHLGKARVKGPGAADFLNSVLTNDLHRIGPGKAQYTLCVDDATGGVVDDLIQYYISDDEVFLIPNAANTTEVVRRLQEAAPVGIEVVNEHIDWAILAVQGTRADELLALLGIPADHGYMSFTIDDWRGHTYYVCRTGYTGERGYELVVPAEAAPSLWDAIDATGVAYGLVPAGLGARDTLRTEMGYPLHGQDISLTISPVEAGLNWAIGWKKPSFWGKSILSEQKEQGPKRVLRGIVAVDRAIPRAHMQAFLSADVPVGEVTSGTFSPTLKKGIGLALVSSVVNEEAQITLDVRGRREVFQIAPPPFVRSRVREA